jgi:protein-S-isoprenylcysteine O-methyltransferase Ste14
MFALTLDQAKTGAALVVIVLVALSIASIWIMKEISQKIAVAVILGLLALLVWTQRASLQECSDKVRAAGVDVNDPNVDTTCTFLGRDVEIKRNSGS